MVRRPVHGVLLLDKPLGLSSNQALQKVKWLLRAEKAGHTGTLDPLATGVLPLCFGAATKFSQIHLDADKTYETVVRLGVRTSTADAEGDVIETRPVTCTAGQVVEVLDSFMGVIEQIPPMHSALKKDGKALYEYARNGETVERAARRVTIHDLELLEMQLSGDEPALRLQVRCSKGTYIRTLGEDIGEALGCGGHLISLRRVATGPFIAEQSVTLEALEAQKPKSNGLHMCWPVPTLPARTTRPSPSMRKMQPGSSAACAAGVIGSTTPACGRFWPIARSDQPPTQPTPCLGSAHTAGGELIPGRPAEPHRNNSKSWNPHHEQTNPQHRHHRPR